MIQTSLRFHPFSHEVPTRCSIPKTYANATIYPVCVEIVDQRDQKKLGGFEFTHGPLKQFTVTLNLEKGRVEITGFVDQKFYSYILDHAGIRAVRGDNTVFLWDLPGQDIEVQACERLSLGCHKKQDVLLLFRRCDVLEFLPIWHFLAQSIPDVEDVENEEQASLLVSLREMIVRRERTKISGLLQDMFLEGFSSLFLPTLQPSGRLGFDSSVIAVPKSATPLIFLKKSFPTIRSLFIQEKKGEIFILPCLPTEMHAGKLVHAKMDGISVSIEWTKHEVRRVFFQASATQSYIFKFSKDIRQFKVNLPLRHVIQKSEEGIVDLVAGESGFFDCFEK